MSEVERRRGIRALRAAPGEFTDEELVELARVIEAETVYRAASRVSYKDFAEVVKNLSAGGDQRLTGSMLKLTQKKPAELTVGDVLSVDPWALLHTGAGPTTMCAILVAFLGLGVVLPPRWCACPSQAIRRPWLCALATYASDPERIRAICKEKRVYRNSGGLVRALDPGRAFAGTGGDAVIQGGASGLGAGGVTFSAGETTAPGMVPAADPTIPPGQWKIQGMGIDPGILPFGHPARVCRGERDGEDGPHFLCSLIACGCSCETCVDHRLPTGEGGV